MLEALEVKTLKASAVVSASAQSAALDLADYEGPITIILQSTASGSGVTNAIKVIECDTSGGSYTDVVGGGFTTVANSASAQVLRLNSDELKRYIELDFTIAGGSGTGVVSASVVGFKKYR